MSIKRLKEKVQAEIKYLKEAYDLEIVESPELPAYEKVLGWIEEESLPDKTLFDDFWKIYPGLRKKDKPKSRTLFNKQNRETQELIINHIRHRSENDPCWLEGNGKFIPGPVPFLNQNGWTDEYRVNELSRFDAKTQKSVGALQEFVNG